MPTAPDSVLPDPQRPFWQRRVREPIVAQLTQGITPEKIALTFAAGSAAALFPVFGVTSILCFFVALWLRLNQPIIQTLNQLLLPVHVAAILLCVRLGETIFQVPPAERLMLDPRKIHHLYFAHFWSHPIRSLTFYVTDNSDSVFYSIVAWAILAPFYIAAVYYTTRPILRSVARIRAEAAAKAVVASPPEHPVP